MPFSPVSFDTDVVLARPTMRVVVRYKPVSLVFRYFIEIDFVAIQLPPGAWQI